MNDTDTPIDTAIPTPGKASWWSTLGWAAYLACSWTWCIGMFLPVLLVRDYGIWGFVVFAVPNVIGAGAMGWVLKNGAAERIFQRHTRACEAFSAVTVMFQGFFAIALVTQLLGNSGGWDGLIVLAAAAVGCALLLVPRAGAALLWVASVALITLAWRGVDYALPGPPLVVGRPGLMWLAPVCIFGFGLCPYLDLTFLRARQLSGTGAKPAFGLGFGVLFLTMILGTLAYSTQVLIALAEPEHQSFIPGLWFIGAHMLLQASFTMALHSREMFRLRFGTSFWARVVVVASALMLIPIALALRAGWISVDLTIEEICYRCFMSFYGLVFPAYVWLCMIPTADGHSGIEGAQGRRKLLVLAAACAIAAPCYWMGFIGRVEWWLAPGLSVVLIARPLVRARITRQG